MDSEKDIVVFVVISSTLVVLALIAMVVNLSLVYIKDKRLKEEKLKAAKNQIDQLLHTELKSLEQGQKEERERIGRFLHDDVVNEVVTVRLNLSQIWKDLDQAREQHEEEFKRLNTNLVSIMDKLRDLSHGLQNRAEKKIDLKEYLTQLKHPLKQAEGLTLSFNIDTIEKDHSDIKRQTLRITQILLTNTLLHSKATEVYVQYREQENKPEYFYSDNGIGFNLETALALGGNGLKNVISRAKEVGGEARFNTENSGMNCSITFNTFQL